MDTRYIVSRSFKAFEWIVEDTSAHVTSRYRVVASGFKTREAAELECSNLNNEPSTVRRFDNPDFRLHRGPIEHGDY